MGHFALGIFFCMARPVLGGETDVMGFFAAGERTAPHAEDAPGR